MNRNSLILPFLLIGIFFAIVIIIGLLFLTTDNTAEPAVDTNGADFPEAQFPDTSEDDVSTEGTPLLTKSGRLVDGGDFLEQSQVELWDESNETYLIASEGNGADELYQIFYFAGGGITVSLLDENLRFARERAEAELERVLGMSQIGICSLQVRVTVPGRVSEMYSGRDLGISYCPGATPI